MESIKYTLIGDGSSDKVLLNIIRWVFNDLYPTLPIKDTFADFSKISNPPKKNDILHQYDFASNYYPFDILFYHRDSEKLTKTIIEERKNEIYSKLEPTKKKNVICVIPKSMMETWLLINEKAIKEAAGNRNYKRDIKLPKINTLENIKDTKKILHDELKAANGNNRKFNVHKAVHLVSEYIEDYSPLRNLEAFQIMESELKEKVNHLLSLNN